MIETIEQTTCKDCGKPLPQSGRKTPHPRAFCNATCRQRYHRKHKAQKTSASIVTQQTVTMNEQDYQARIAALEEEVATLKALAGKRTYGKMRAGLQRRLMERGKVIGYPAVTIRVPVSQGVEAWRAFAKDASEDMLARAIVAAGGS